MDRTSIVVDRDTRDTLKEIAARNREMIYQLVARLAAQEFSKLADKPRKAATK